MPPFCLKPLCQLLSTAPCLASRPCHLGPSVSVEGRSSAPKPEKVTFTRRSFRRPPERDSRPSQRAKRLTLAAMSLGFGVVQLGIRQRTTNDISGLSVRVLEPDTRRQVGRPCSCGTALPRSPRAGGRSWYPLPTIRDPPLDELPVDLLLRLKLGSVASQISSRR